MQCSLKDLGFSDLLNMPELQLEVSCWHPLEILQMGTVLNDR